MKAAKLLLLFGMGVATSALIHVCRKKMDKSLFDYSLVPFDDEEENNKK